MMMMIVGVVMGMIMVM